MTENQKFAFLVFALVMIGLVVLVYVNIKGSLY